MIPLAEITTFGKKFMEKQQKYYKENASKVPFLIRNTLHTSR
jgi:hypothetical protein